jgi:hypothetical protein
LLTAALVPGGPRWLASTLEVASIGDFARRRRFLTIASFVAAFVSLGYVALYLRGGPRAPEAAAYWLQGRALSHGALAWTPPEPAASFRAHFLWFYVPDRLAGIFPPGFPLLLAPAFLVGAPMLVGPLLAAALVLASWFLAREIAADAGAAPNDVEAVGRIAAGFSIVSAALRYHTADVLPYGAAAAAVAASLAFALRAARTRDFRLFGVAGALVGLLVATLPQAALASSAILVWLALRVPGPARALAWAVLSALPGTWLLLAANHAATGRTFASPAGLYFASVDSGAATNATSVFLLLLQRLRGHLSDVDNFEPLALLALVPVLVKPRTRAASMVAMVAAVYVVTCAPLEALRAERGLPGAGRLIGAPTLVGVVAVEHALMAVGLWRLFPRSLGPAVAGTVALALAGFAVHASYDHMKLAISGYGRPRFEPDIAREANLAHGLLFFEDDEGYEIASDPGVVASHGVLAARLRGDDHDRLLYDSLGHPLAHRYSLSPMGASVVPWTPSAAASDMWKFEAEADWPPASLSGGHAQVLDSPNPCASDGRVLLLTPAAGREATVTLELPVPRGATPPERRVWNVIPRVLQRGGAGTGALSLVAELHGPPLADWTWSDTVTGPTCLELPARPVELGGERTRAWLILRGNAGPVALDKTTLRAPRP